MRFKFLKERGRRGWAHYNGGGAEQYLGTSWLRQEWREWRKMAEEGEEPPTAAFASSFTTLPSPAWRDLHGSYFLPPKTNSRIYHLGKSKKAGHMKALS